MKATTKVLALITLAGTADAFSPAPIFGSKAVSGWAGVGRGSFLLAKV